MRQLVHIFWKDVRGLRAELALFLGWLLVGRVYIAVRPEYVDYRSAMDAPLELLTIAVGCYLIARLIHLEAFANNRQYWLTRPYRWKSLLGAKILFLLAGVHLPVFVTQAAVLYAEGFPIAGNLPGLLWFQFLMFVCISLPAAALAAVTPGLASFIAALTSAVAVWSLFSLLRSTWWVREHVLPSSDYLNPVLRQSEWVRTGVLMVAGAVAASIALYFQYRSRRALLSRGALISIGLAGVLIHSFSVSAGFRWDVQSATSTQTIDTSSWRFSVGPPEPIHRFPPSPLNEMDVMFTVPVHIYGVPPNFDVRAQRVVSVLYASDGESIESEPSLNYSHRQVWGSAWYLPVRFFTTEEFYGKIHKDGGTVRTALDLVAFGNERLVTIPAASFPANVGNTLRCRREDLGGGGFPQDILVKCRAALRWPADNVSVEGRLLAGPDSYSPFPADLRLDPIIDRGSKTIVAGTPEQIHFSFKAPVSYGRVTFDIPNVQLREP